MSMKNIVRLVIACAVAFCVFLVFKRPPSADSASVRQDASTVQKLTTVSKPADSVSSPVAEPSTVSKKTITALPPVTNHPLLVWDNSGELTSEVIARYKLSSDQISQLKRLKAECVLRMQAIDLANASVSLSEDGKSVSITIKPDAASAQEFTEFYRNSLAQILGSNNYADLAKYYDSPTMDDSMNAGLVDKQIVVQKVAVNPQGVQYHIKAETKLRVSPTDLPPAFNSRKVETTGNRTSLSVAYAGIDNLLPKNF